MKNNVYCGNCEWEGNIKLTKSSPIGPICPECLYEVSSGDEFLQEQINNLEIKTK